MNSLVSILSTKKLASTHKERLLNAGIGFVAYDAIAIEMLEVAVHEISTHAIFTSKNAVNAIQDSIDKIQYAFCVGENTKKLLEAKGCIVVATAANASILADQIIEKYKNESFVFFCGDKRRDELPLKLKENHISLQEEVVYKTHIKSKEFHRSFDGILFFSPSGVQSYMTRNTMGDSVAFCIGATTASEAKKYTDTIIIANKPTVANVMVQAVQYFQTRI